MTTKRDDAEPAPMQAPLSDTAATLHHLVEQIQVTASNGAGPDPVHVKHALEQALKDESDWLDRRYQQLGEGPYSLYPLYRADDGRCSILSVALRPGLPLPVHNHGTWAVIGIYRGREQETWYRRLDDGSVRGRAALEVERTFVNERGAVGIVPDGKIHTVEALEGSTVSIHIYGTDIVTQERSTFDLQAGTEEIFRPPFEAVE